MIRTLTIAAAAMFAGTALAQDAAPKTLTIGDKAPQMDVQVMKGKLPAKLEDGTVQVVEFWATWCGPCKAIGPYFEELAAKFPDVTFVKVDVDELDDVAASCGISAMPTFQLYSNGVMVKEMCGADKAKLEALAIEAKEL